MFNICVIYILHYHLGKSPQAMFEKGRAPHKQTWKMTGSSVRLPHSKQANQIFSPSGETGGNSVSLLRVRHLMWITFPWWFNPLCLTTLLPKPVRSRDKSSEPFFAHLSDQKMLSSADKIAAASVLWQMLQSNLFCKSCFCHKQTLATATVSF